MIRELKETLYTQVVYIMCNTTEVTELTTGGRPATPRCDD